MPRLFRGFAGRPNHFVCFVMRRLICNSEDLSDWADAQADQSSLGAQIILFVLSRGGSFVTAKTLIRLGGSEYFLGAQIILFILSWGGSFIKYIYIFICCHLECQLFFDKIVMPYNGFQISIFLVACFYILKFVFTSLCDIVELKCLLLKRKWIFMENIAYISQEHLEVTMQSFRILRLVQKKTCTLIQLVVGGISPNRSICSW